MRIVGSMLVRNEDLFVEQAIRNVAGFCDHIHAVDHVSNDHTWDILRALAGEYDHLDVRRARHTRESHRVLEPYVGTRTWVLRVDGDELYDSAGLSRVREVLDEGEFDAAFRVQASVLHCVSLDRESARASGYLSPPSRPITALFNLAAADSWTGCAERLHGGTIPFRPGYGWQSVDALQDRYSWEENPLRYLHVCFLRRSSLDPEEAEKPRLSLGEMGTYRRGVVGTVVRAVRPPYLDPKVREIHAGGSTWKLDRYRRGLFVVKDAGPFFRE